jgi:hypothetical protein
MSGVAIGDGDSAVEGVRTRAAPGGFLATDELVIFSNNAGALTAAGAAAVIGSATSGYAVGRKALFVVDDGTSSAVFRFVAADGDAAVEAGELTLLAVLAGTPATGIADVLFGA